MAYGLIEVIPASAHAELPLSGVGGGTQYPSIKVLNPNDGVVYVSRNRDCVGVNYGMWDWKVPSQSYAALPGPFQSVGAYYLDQSGAGRQGEITFYPSQQELADPLFVAIGRALQAQTTTLDITEGAQPANPGSGLLRLWADGGDLLHLLNGAGVDRSVIDTLRALGGALTGTLPNPGIANGAVVTASIAATAVSQYANVQGAPGQSTTSITLVAMPTFSVSMTTTGGVLLIFAVGSFTNNLSGVTASLAAQIDSGGYTVMGSARENVAGAEFQVVGTIISLPAASAHTINLGWATSGGTLSQNGGALSSFTVLELKR